MIRKQRYRPFYKQFLRIRQNVQNRKKVFKFKKQKWQKFQSYSKKQLKFYKKFKLKDSFKLVVSRFASKGNSLQKNFNNRLIEKKLFNLTYGGLKQKYLKRKVNKINKLKKNKFLNFKNYLLKFFESRLDIILYKSKFSLSVKNARQLIKHGNILVNKKRIKTPSYIVKTNDLIEVSLNKKSRELVQKYIKYSNFWPIPPKYLIINYKTLQIIYIYNKTPNILSHFTHQLNFSN